MYIQNRSAPTVHWFSSSDSDFHLVNQLCDWVFPRSALSTLSSTDCPPSHLAAIMEYQKIIACGQLKPTPAASGRRYYELSKMAVARPFIYCGYRDILLLAMMSQAKQLCAEGLFLRARVEAVDFYRSYGFVEFAEIYLDRASGCPHQQMIALLT